MVTEPARVPSERGVRGASGRVPRVLVLAESLPIPTVKGGDLRAWQNVNALAKFARVGVFGLCSNDTRMNVVPDVPLECWLPSTDEALTSPPPTGMRLKGRAWLLDPDGHPSDIHFSEGAADELSALLARLKIDTVVVEGLWLQRYLAVARAAGCRTILDCHNVEAALFRELASASEGDGLPARTLREVLPARTEAIEAAAVRSADQVWVCSSEDKERLRDFYGDVGPVEVVPNGVRLDGDGHVSAPSRPHARDGAPLTLVFPGIYSYLPNLSAARFLVDEIFPRLLEACGGDCRLFLVGPDAPAELRAASGCEGRIVVTGPVRAVRPWLDGATAMAVPLFQGGGTRLKVLEAFAARLPVVSTGKGVEGLGVRDGVHVLLAETADEFVEGLVAVWCDLDLAGRLGRHARTLVEERFSWNVVGARIEDAIGALGATQ
jgi:glycosyltransferase involved in cell wall biosynthesis